MTRTERLNHRMPVIVGKPCVKDLMNCIMNRSRRRRRMVVVLVTRSRVIYETTAVGLHTSHFLDEIMYLPLRHGMIKPERDRAVTSSG